MAEGLKNTTRRFFIPLAQPRRGDGERENEGVRASLDMAMNKKLPALMMGSITYLVHSSSRLAQQ